MVDNALYKQFVEWFNGLPEPTTNNRTKRSTINEDLLGRFLREVYPGANQIPTAMVRMMANPTITPDQKISSTALLHKDDRCSNPDSSIECPEPFVSLKNTDQCIHDPNTEMTLDEANEYSLNLESSNARLFQFENIAETKELFEYLKTGSPNVHNYSIIYIALFLTIG